MLQESRLLRVFHLLLRHLLTDALATELEAYDLSPAQYHALRYVAHATLYAGECDISSLASALGTSVPAATKMADRLQAAGWLERRDAPHDRRHTLLQLTPQGDVAVDQLSGCTERAVQTILQQLTTEEREQLVTGILAFTRHSMELPMLRNVCLFCGKNHAPDCPLAGKELESIQN